MANITGCRCKTSIYCKKCAIESYRDKLVPVFEGGKVISHELSCTICKGELQNKDFIEDVVNAKPSEPPEEKRAAARLNSVTAKSIPVNCGRKSNCKVAKRSKTEEKKDCRPLVVRKALLGWKKIAPLVVRKALLGWKKINDTIPCQFIPRHIRVLLTEWKIKRHPMAEMMGQEEREALRVINTTPRRRGRGKEN